MNGNSQFFQRLNVAGQLPSAINAAVVDLLGKGVLTYEQAMTVLTPTRLIGGALAELASWGAEVPAPALKPGQVVVDAGGGDPNNPVGTGTIDPAILTRENWAYVQQKNLGAKWGVIFSGALSAYNAALGRFTQGDLATATPNPVCPDGSNLAAWG